MSVRVRVKVRVRVRVRVRARARARARVSVRVLDIHFCASFSICKYSKILVLTKFTRLTREIPQRQAEVATRMDMGVGVGVGVGGEVKQVVTVARRRVRSGGCSTPSEPPRSRRRP